MNKTDKILEAAKRILAKLNGEPVAVKFAKEGTTSDGVKVVTEADDWSVGAEVFVDVDGLVSPAPDGEHTIDKLILVVKDGKIEEVKEVVDEIPVDAELEAAIETALSAVVKDRDKYAAELTAKNEAIQKLAADIAAKDQEITNLKAQNITLSKQIGSIQDAPAAPAKGKSNDPELGADGRPKNWSKLNAQERVLWTLNNYSN